jgi:hypothetical protein
MSEYHTSIAERPLPDHVEASALLLERFAKRLRNGEAPADLGVELILAARVIARGL